MKRASSKQRVERPTSAPISTRQPANKPRRSFANEARRILEWVTACSAGALEWPLQRQDGEYSEAWVSEVFRNLELAFDSHFWDAIPRRKYERGWAFQNRVDAFRMARQRDLAATVWKKCGPETARRLTQILRSVPKPAGLSDVDSRIAFLQEIERFDLPDERAGNEHRRSTTLGTKDMKNALKNLVPRIVAGVAKSQKAALPTMFRAELAPLESGIKSTRRAVARAAANDKRKPIVVFSNRFMRAYCIQWGKPEERQRSRHADMIMRRLYENWKDKNQWMPVDDLLVGCKADRLDKALCSKRYPQTFALVDRPTENSTGRRTARLKDSYEYRVE